MVSIEKSGNTADNVPPEMGAFGNRTVILASAAACCSMVEALLDVLDSHFVGPVAGEIDVCQVGQYDETPSACSTPDIAFTVR